MSQKIDFKQLLNTADSEHITKFLTEQRESNHRRFINQFLPQSINFYLSQDEVDIDTVNAIWTLSSMELTRVTDKSLGILAIQTLLLMGNYDGAVALFDKLLEIGNCRKKMMLVLVQYQLALNRVADAAALLIKHHVKFGIDAADIASFMNHPDTEIAILKEILHNVINQPVILSEMPTNEKLFTEAKSDESLSELKKIAYTTDELRQLQATFTDLFSGKGKTGNKQFTEFCDWLHKNSASKFDVVIDAANVMYYGEREVNVRSFIKLDLTIKTLIKLGHRVLLVVHHRHFKLDQYGRAGSKQVRQKLADWRKQRKLKIYETPTGLNDDWFHIFAAIYNDALLITNDQFRDHIYQTPLLVNWVKEHTVGFKITNSNKNIEFMFPSPWSVRVQKVGPKFYVPVVDSTTGDSEWLLIS